VANPRFSEDHLVEASPADQQPLLRLERLHRPMKTPIYRRVRRPVLRYHLTVRGVKEVRRAIACSRAADKRGRRQLVDDALTALERDPGV
jgi:hypothetical protein